MDAENESVEPPVVPMEKLQQKLYHLKMGGQSYHQISDDVNLPIRTVKILIDNYIEMLETVAGTDEKRQALVMENSRLDGLHAIAWEAAMSGDLKAIDIVLKISARRAKIMGLDLVPTQEIQVTQNTLVMGSKEEFIDALIAGKERQLPENVIEGRVVREEVQ